MSRCYLYGLRIPQSFQTARFYSRLRSVPLIRPEASRQKNRQRASRFLLYMSGAGMKAEFIGGGGIFCDFFKIHCRSINVDSACGSVILIFSKIHCRVCYATAESGSANRHFSKIYRRDSSAGLCEGEAGVAGSAARRGRLPVVRFLRHHIVVAHAVPGDLCPLGVRLAPVAVRIDRDAAARQEAPPHLDVFWVEQRD